MVYFSSAIRMQFTNLPRLDYQRIADLKYHMSNWKYIIDAARHLRTSAYRHFTSTLPRNVTFFPHFLLDFQCSRRQSFIQQSIWLHLMTTTNAIDILTLRQGPCGRCDEEEDAEKINEFFFFFVYECVWARNAWVIKASSFRIAYHHLLSGARNAYD